jgi:hypothetical protein
VGSSSLHPLPNRVAVGESNSFCQQSASGTRPTARAIYHDRPTWIVRRPGCDEPKPRGEVFSGIHYAIKDLNAGSSRRNNRYTLGFHLREIGLTPISTHAQKTGSRHLV